MADVVSPPSLPDSVCLISYCRACLCSMCGAVVSPVFSAFCCRACRSWLPYSCPSVGFRASNPANCRACLTIARYCGYLPRMTTYNPDPGSGPASRRAPRTIKPGDTFGPNGQLVVVCRAKPKRGGADKSRAWLCQCKCGKSKVIRHGHLTSGHTVSCGCVSMRAFQRVATPTGRVMPADPRVPS